MLADIKQIRIGINPFKNQNTTKIILSRKKSFNKFKETF